MIPAAKEAKAQPLSRKLKIYYSIARGTARRHKARLFIGGVGAMLLLLFFIQYFSIFFDDGGNRYVQGIVGRYSRENLPPTIENLVSYGLTKTTKKGEATASAAKDWDVSADGKEYTFYLREDLKWQDGSEFTANDLTKLFETVQTRVENPTEIHFYLKNPFTPFPTLLSKPLLKGKNLLGLGEYKFTEIEESGGILTQVTLQQLAEPNRIIVFRFYASTQDMLSAYKLGELDGMYGYFNPAQIKNWPTVSYKNKTDYQSYVAVLYNTKYPLLEEKQIRQALTFAIPKDTLPGELATSPISPESWAFNPEVKQYVYDMNLASELLKKAQPPEGSTLTIHTTAAFASLANQIADSWTKSGITTNVVVGPEVPKDYQVAIVRQQIPADPDQYTMWHSLQKNGNVTAYSDERIDKILEDARVLADPESRKKKYYDFQKFIAEDVPAAFLYYPQETLLMQKRYDQPFYRQINGFD